MSQEQPRRRTQESIKYGDVFPQVSGGLSQQPVKPQDAAMMQTAENQIFGKTQKGGPAAVMQSAATRNERAGLVGHTDVNVVPADEGVTVTETDVPGRRIITESVGDQVVGQYSIPTPAPTNSAPMDAAALTIGEALEATAMTAGNKPVDQADASAIQAAEVRATGMNATVPGGLAATAQAAADYNTHVLRDEDKAKMSDVLKDATSKLPADKPVTREDAERVIGAEMRNRPGLTTHPTGVAASVAAAARLNQSREQ